MKRIFLALLLFLPTYIFAEVNQFVFITDIQSISPNVISKDIKVQSQDSSGTEENVTETFDIVFTSSSLTGKFLNSSGNAVSKTMSKNTSNRTFYYRDSSLGEHTLTLDFTGRDSQKKFTSSQKIIVGNVLSTTTNNQNTNTSTNTSVESSHSSQSSASINSDQVSFEVSIGRDRFSSVGNNLSFKADLLKLSGVSPEYIQYKWSFGDGSKSEGKIVNHKYKFAGEYNVILNASFSDKSAVARVKVNIINPILELSFVSGGLEIVNKSVGEINLGEWTIDNGISRFQIPEDTIIGVSKKIVFPNDITNIIGNEISLKNPLGNEVFRLKKDAQGLLKASPVISSTTLNVATTSDIVISKKNEISKPVLSKSINKKETKEVLVKKEEKTEELVVSTASKNNIASVYVADVKVGTFSKFFGFIKNIFKK